MQAAKDRGASKTPTTPRPDAEATTAAICRWRRYNTAPRETEHRADRRERRPPSSSSMSTPLGRPPPPPSILAAPA